jgi:NAD(P)-dependent dehydrogenase (short-subunit alcohol dehydrogenase family)
LKGKVAFITGASRGIGRVCALELAKCGCNVVVAAKSTVATKELPGSIYTVAEELEKMGVKALPIQLDIRDAEACEKAVQKTVETFGRIDILLNNASALWWHTVDETPMKKYDLITQINTRGAFALTRACMPHMKKQKYGRVVCCSPPILSNYQAYKGMTAYFISKFGMTMVAMGAAAEGADDNVTGCSIWPATVVESQAATNFELGDKSIWRTGQVISEALLGVLAQPGSFTGQQLIDDEFLMSQGWTLDEVDEHFAVVKGSHPPRLLATKEGAVAKEGKQATVTRGDVRKVVSDKDRTDTYDGTSKL